MSLTTLRASLLATLLTLTAAPVVAEAAMPLAEEPHINGQLVAAMVGDIIRKQCPEIEGRYTVAVTRALALKRYALDQGYTEEEIEVFLDSKAEKARIRALAKAYLLEQGAASGDVAAHCAVGRAEIAKGSLTGSLLSGE